MVFKINGAPAFRNWYYVLNVGSSGVHLCDIDPLPFDTLHQGPLPTSATDSFITGRNELAMSIGMIELNLDYIVVYIYGHIRSY